MIVDPRTKLEFPNDRQELTAAAVTELDLKHIRC